MRAPATRARQRGFFDFSITELAIIFGLALVVLGPKKLPPLVKQIGRWVGRARHMARQFREQLEQEVDSINSVKPVPRNVAPEVGPAAPETAPADLHAHAPDGNPGTEATGVVEPAAAEADAAAAVEPPANQLHPEAQIYFAMNGTEPEVVAHNPHDPPPAADDPAAAAPPTHVQSDAAQAPPAAAAKPEEPGQLASVEVVFPHDHG